MQDGTGLCLPALPAGYTAAAAWGFRGAGGLVYEFFRVYSNVGGTWLTGGRSSNSTKIPRLLKVSEIQRDT